MPSEKQMWDRLRKVLIDLRLDPVRVENPALPGTPDVNYIEGWIELKYVEAWPKKAETPLRIPHYTSEQKTWLMRRWIKGGNAFMLLRVGDDWILLDAYSAQMVGKATQEEIYADALWISGDPQYDSIALKKWLRAGMWGDGLGYEEKAMWKRLRVARSVEQVAKDLGLSPQHIRDMERGHSDGLVLRNYWKNGG